MTLDAMADAIKRLVVRGKKRGYVTYDELILALPREKVSPEVIEDAVSLLDEMGIHLAKRGDSEDGEATVEGPWKPLSPLSLQPGAEAPLDSSQG